MENDNKYLVPGAIVIAGILIAGAFIYSKGIPGSTNLGAGARGDLSGKNGEIEEITADDHILGNPEASLVVVEYSDFECPYCKTFHDTMHQIIDEYGKEGEVAWVYRQLPLTELHSKAVKEAEASECAADLGGNDAFWAYADKLFEITPSNDGLDLELLPQIAEDIGLDRDEFEQCLDSGKYEDKVMGQREDALDAGAIGTPHSVILTKDGQKVLVGGAEPFESLKSAIDSLLEQE